ncbi:MAG: SCO family protein [Acidobacteriota bacterium]|nr:SCO family protein [Acidobacteriota bacterium]
MRGIFTLYELLMLGAGRAALLVGLSVVYTLLCARTSTAQEMAHHAHMMHGHDETAAAETTKEVSVRVPDVEVLDETGRRLHFYRDLVRGRTVAINFIFTTCTTICPPMGATFAKVQSLAAGRAGADVQLISVSVDPATDTPERLKAWGAKFKARPGWTFVTGQLPQINELLKALGGFSGRREDHSPVVLIGNDATGVWTRANGLASPAKLLAAIDEVGRPAKSSDVERPMNSSDMKEMHHQ